MKRIKYITFFLFSSFLLFSCDSEPEEVEPEGSMTCTLNGSTWTAISFNNTLLRVVDEEPTGKRLDLRGKAEGIQIILSCGITSSSVGTDIPVAVYESGSSYEALVTIMSGFTIEGMATGYDGDDARIHLTHINGSERTCSGTFEFKTSDIGTDEINYEALDGVFTDLKYVVM